MILLIDVGGTRLKWATWNGEFSFGGAEAYGADPLAWFGQRSWPRASTVWISLVPRVHDVPGWTAAVQAACGVTPRFAASQAEWRGLRIAYERPQAYGVDRWLGLVALWAGGHAPFVLVSGGTALTVDRLDAAGQHLGGVIAAGFGSMHRALLHATRTDVQAEPRHHYSNELGRNPVAAIHQGALFSTLGVIHHALRAPGALAGEARFLTGGDAPALLPLLGAGWVHRPHLVLEGLLALARDSA